MIEFFARKNEGQAGTAMPESWLENISLLLNETYPELTELHISAQIWSELFENELLTIVSLSHQDETPPITFLISADVDQQSDKQLKKSLDKSIEVIGMMIEGYLSSLKNDQLYEHIHQWTEEKKNKFTFYYRTTREDISLTLKANKLLNQ